MVFFKYPKVRFKQPAETTCFCSRFISFTKLKGFLNMACIFNLANIFLIYDSFIICLRPCLQAGRVTLVLGLP